MLLTAVLLIIGAVILIVYRGKSIDIYIGSIGDTDINGVDIQLKINNKTVWENNIHSGLNNYTKLHHNLKFGYNAIEVLSKNKDLLIKKNVFILTGNGDVVEPEDGVAAIGSGGTYALAAAKGIIGSSNGLPAEEIVKRAMHIAADICVYSNHNIIIEKVSK
ncbi:MAG: HslU--HslV peptidase proteolytic subunit [Pseudomonadota bacterium]